MLRLVTLLLPVVIPSWRFFPHVAASPRFEVASPGGAWRPFRPLPPRLTPGQMLGRLVWNPRWNETLFLVSCAERLLADGRAHARDEILARIRASEDGPVRVRLLLVSREGRDLVEEVVWTNDDGGP